MGLRRRTWVLNWDREGRTGLVRVRIRIREG